MFWEQGMYKKTSIQTKRPLVGLSSLRAVAPGSKYKFSSRQAGTPLDAASARLFKSLATPRVWESPRGQHFQGSQEQKSRGASRPHPRS